MPRGQRNDEFWTKDKRKLPIFIHSELDDYGLSCVEFRTYSRIARRAGECSKATESAPHMAEAFGVEVSTVRRALKVLCLCRLISKHERPGWTPEYVLEPKENWRDKSELKAIRESVLHPKRKEVTLCTSHRGKESDPMHQPSGTPMRSAQGPYAPAIDESTPQKVLPEGTPSAKRVTPGSQDELKKRARYSITEIEANPAILGKMSKDVRAMFPTVDFADVFRQWLRARVIDGCIGRNRGKANLVQYRYDMERYFEAYARNLERHNGNGYSKPEPPPRKTILETLREQGVRTILD